MVQSTAYALAGTLNIPCKIGLDLVSSVYKKYGEYQVLPPPKKKKIHILYLDPKEKFLKCIEMMSKY